MRKLYYFLLLVLTVAACNRPAAVVGTAPASAPNSVSLAPTAKDTSLLWQISGPGIDQPSYLFGTIHIIPEEDYFLPSTVVRALNDVEEVVFEIDPRAMQDPTVIMSLMDKLVMRGDTSIEDLLSAEDYATVEGYFTQAGLPFLLFKKMKPLFLSAMVGQDLTGMASGGGMSGIKSYEFELTELATGAEKRIGGLETIEFQLDIFDQIPYQGQAKMLLDAIESEISGDGAAQSQMDQIVDMYKRKAVAEMASSISAMSNDSQEFEELLLNRRNETWAPMIEEQLRRADGGPLLYAVGAGHLGGERGVIALLRGRGLTVSPVYR